MNDINQAPRLLVVDDDPGVIAAYRLVLERSAQQKINGARNVFGLHDVEASLFPRMPVESFEWRISYKDQGSAAIAAVKNAIKDGDPFTATFLDVRMPPGMDGFETAEKIRKIDSDIHIVIVTGYSDYYYEDFLEVAGPAHKLTFLEKPLWPEELRQLSKSLGEDYRRHLGMAAR